MHLKDLLGSIVRVGYRIPVSDFYLVLTLHGLRCRKKHYNGLINQSIYFSLFLFVCSCHSSCFYYSLLFVVAIVFVSISACSLFVLALFLVSISACSCSCRRCYFVASPAAFHLVRMCTITVRTVTNAWVITKGKCEERNWSIDLRIASDALSCLLIIFYGYFISMNDKTNMNECNLSDRQLATSSGK